MTHSAPAQPAPAHMPTDAPSASPSGASATAGIGSGHALLALERFLPYRLSVLSNRVSQSIARAYADRFAIGITEWRVLAVLGRHPGLSANGVAERTAMDKVAVSRAVARLLERDLIRRDTDGEDRRRSVLQLSEAGYAIYDEVVPVARACERTLMTHLDAQEAEQLDRLLGKLEAGMRGLEDAVEASAEGMPGPPEGAGGPG